MQHTPHILAAGEDLVIPVIIFIIWGISAIAGLGKKANQSKTLQRPRVIAPRPPQNVRRSEFTIPARTLQGPPPLAPAIQRRMPAVPQRSVMPPVRSRAVMMPAPQQVRAPVATAPRPQAPIAAPAPPPAQALVLQEEPAPGELLVEPLEENWRQRVMWMEILGKPLALREDF